MMGTILGPLGAKIGLGLSLLLLVAFGVQTARLSASQRHLKDCRTTHAQFVADVKANTELARISDAAHKAQVERDQEKERADHEAEIQHLRADYAGRVRDYAKAHPGSSRGPSVPSTPNAPSVPIAASGTAIVPVRDLEICAVNTATDESWLSWWRSVQAIPR